MKIESFYYYNHIKNYKLSDVEFNWRNNAWERVKRKSEEFHESLISEIYECIMKDKRLA